MEKIKNFFKSLYCPIYSTFLYIGILYYINFNFMDIYDDFTLSTKEDRIKSQIYKIAESCRNDIWVSWLVHDTYSNYFRFKDVVGCAIDPNFAGYCGFSVKYNNLNENYHKNDFYLDDKTKKMLYNIKNGMVASFHDMEKLKELKTSKSLLMSTNKKIQTVYLTNYWSDNTKPIYTFIITQTAENTICNGDDIVKKLEDLYLFVKEQS